MNLLLNDHMRGGGAQIYAGGKAVLSKVCTGACREPPSHVVMQPLVKDGGERSPEGVDRPHGSAAP